MQMSVSQFSIASSVMIFQKQKINVISPNNYDVFMIGFGGGL